MLGLDMQGNIAGIIWKAEKTKRGFKVKFENGISAVIEEKENWFEYTYSNGIVQCKPKDIFDFELFPVLFDSVRNGKDCTVVVSDYKPSHEQVTVKLIKGGVPCVISLMALKRCGFCAYKNRYVLDMLKGSTTVDKKELSAYQTVNGVKSVWLRQDKVKLTNGVIIGLDEWINMTEETAIL